MSTKDPIPIDPAVHRTGELMTRSRQCLAYGGMDGIVQRPLCDVDGGTFPQFAGRAEGCELLDTTGKSCIDWVNGYGSSLLGYRHPEVEAAIREQLTGGPTLTLMHPIEVEVAERIIEMVPCAEMVGFGKNGSDAVNAAVRLCRAVTGREIMLQHGFHGFHEWYTCLFPEVKGIPTVFRQLVHPFSYNELVALEELFQRFSGRVAGVVMEPVSTHLPEAGYLEGVRELCRKNGALLVFDEILTAFRLANGGAQEFFGVVPDLACLGKGMANGMPLSAIVGKREYMQYLPSVGYGMTFRGETLSLAAARAVLDVLKREPVVEHLAAIGRKMRTAFHQACDEIGIRCELIGPDAGTTFAFQDDGGLDKEDLRTLFLQEALKHGVLSNGALLPSYAHDDRAVGLSMKAFRDALRLVAEAVRAGRVREGRPHGGSPHHPRAFVANGFIDLLREDPDVLHVVGWILLENGAPDRIDLVAMDGTTVTAIPFQREDIAEAFPNARKAERSGYAMTVPAHSFATQEDYEFTLCAFRESQVAFRCRVLYRRRATPASLGPFWIGDGVLYI